LTAGGAGYGAPAGPSIEEKRMAEPQGTRTQAAAQTAADQSTAQQSAGAVKAQLQGAREVADAGPPGR
jgi:hypothetical protein